MKSHNCFKAVLALGTGVFVMLLISGCSMFGSHTASSEDNVPQMEDKMSEASRTSTAVYHDFEDVLIPVQLSVIQKKTMMVSTPGYRSGILSLKGRVDSNSLYDFFSRNMEKDNWKILSRIKSPDTTIMVFQKTARCAVFTIRDRQIYTYVDIAVAPTLVGGSTIQNSDNLTY